MPAPPGRLVTVVGADENDEFRRQTALIAKAWGSDSVVASETAAGRNHMDVLHELADPRARTHRLGLGLSGLASIGTDSRPRPFSRPRTKLAAEACEETRPEAAGPNDRLQKERRAPKNSAA